MINLKFNSWNSMHRLRVNLLCWIQYYLIYPMVPTFPTAILNICVVVSLFFETKYCQERTSTIFNNVGLFGVDLSTFHNFMRVIWWPWIKYVGWMTRPNKPLLVTWLKHSESGFHMKLVKNTCCNRGLLVHCIKNLLAIGGVNRLSKNISDPSTTDSKLINDFCDVNYLIVFRFFLFQ